MALFEATKYYGYARMAESAAKPDPRDRLVELSRVWTEAAFREERHFREMASQRSAWVGFHPLAQRSMLFLIDPEPYQIAVDSARAQLGITRDQIAAQIETYRARVKEFPPDDVCGSHDNSAGILASGEPHLKDTMRP